MPHRKSRLLIIATVLCFAPELRAQSVQLTQLTVETFNNYVSHAESGMTTEIQSGRLFWIDNLPTSERNAGYERLRKGEILIERVSGALIPGGLVHHWKGMAFFPGASLSRTLQLLQDYRNYKNVYSPTVVQSSLTTRSGSDFGISLRLKQKKVVTVVLSTDYTIQYMNPLSFPTDFSFSVGSPGSSTSAMRVL